MSKGGLGRVQVFRLGVAQRSRAEADQPAVAVADREHEPVAEPVVDAPVVSPAGESGLDQLVGRGALAGEVAEQGVPALRRESELEALGGIAVDAPLFEQAPARLAVRGVPEHMAEPGSRKRVQFGQPEEPGIELGVGRA